MRFAVALNGMVVYLADAQGVVQEYTNIVLGEPPASLFLPEPGAAVLKKHLEQLLSPDAGQRYRPDR
jgi:hypothetical protein